MIRFLHMADSHLGFSAYNALDPETKTNQRTQDFLGSYQQAIDIAIEENVDFVLHAGDLFNNVRPNSATIQAAAQPLKTLTENGIPFIVIAGNHDRPSSIGVGSPVKVLQLIESIHAFSQPGLGKIKIGTKTVSIVAIPFLHGRLGEKLSIAVEKSAWEKADWNILLLHQTLANATRGAEIRLASAAEETIPSSLLDEQFDYVACGHVHRHQIHRHPRNRDCTIAYPGSGERVDFDERDEEKGCILVNASKKSFELEFIELPSRPMIEIPVQFQEETGAEAAEIIRGILRSSDIDEKIIGVSFHGRLSAAAYTEIPQRAIAREFDSATNLRFYDSYLALVTEEGTPLSLSQEWTRSPQEELALYINTVSGLSPKLRKRILELGNQIIASGGE